MKIAVINGPNLNMLGIREPGVYGNESLTSLINSLKTQYPQLEIYDCQSNNEGELITAIQKLGMDCDGVVINPGGYSHTSVAIRDAISSVTAPVIEVHITNIHSREEFRHNTVTGGACIAVISGLGFKGYSVAIDYLILYPSVISS